MVTNRRGFLTGLAAAIAAPAVVRAGILMPLRGVVLPAPIVWSRSFDPSQWADIVDRILREDSRKYFDIQAYLGWYDGVRIIG